MSKLLIQYEELKKKNSKKIYIFKVGIFYNILNDEKNKKRLMEVQSTHGSYQWCRFTKRKTC